MSGRKRIFVDEGEWNRLLQQAGELAQVRRDLPRLIEQVRDQAEAEARRSAVAFEQRQRTVEARLGKLSERARQHEHDTSVRLAEVGATLRQELSEAVARSDQRARDLVQQHHAQVEAVLDRERTARRTAVEELDRRVSALQSTAESAQEQARIWLADAQVLAAAVEELPHERFQPGRLRELRARMERLGRNDEGGLIGYALVPCQELYHDVSTLRAEVTLAHERFLHDVQVASAGLSQVVLLVQENRTATLRDASGRPLPGGQFDVNHWSRGALARLADDVDTLLVRVRDQESPITPDELRQVIDRALPELNERLDGIVRQAGSALYASQLRANCADLIVQVLEQDLHYHFDGDAYAGGDERNAYYARAADRDGAGQVVVQVDAHESLDAPEIRVLTYGAGTETEEIRSARARAIERTLHDGGIPVNGVQEEPGAPDRRHLDLDGVGQAARRAPQAGR